MKYHNLMTINYHKKKYLKQGMDEVRELDELQDAGTSTSHSTHQSRI